MIIIRPNLFKKYDVALSFAEENRVFVDCVAKLLKDQGIKIFYDDDLRIPSWGKYLRKYLDKAYRLQARYCVVFVSEDYKRKRWTNFELGRAQARSFFENNAGYVLPYLLDESDFAEQFLDVGCLTFRTHDERKLAEAIKEKLNLQPQRKLNIWFKDLYRIKRRFSTTIVLLLGGGTFLLKDHLTPVDTLTEKIYEEGGRNIRGSVCKDGWFSHSNRSGTCSHHGGIDIAKDSVVHNKTLEQCRKEAEDISWLGP